MDPDPASLLHTIDFDFIFGIIAIIMLLACSAFISGSEVALFSLSQKDIDEVQNKDFNKDISDRLNEHTEALLKNKFSKHFGIPFRQNISDFIKKKSY